MWAIRFITDVVSRSTFVSLALLYLLLLPSVVESRVAEGGLFDREIEELLVVKQRGTYGI